MNWGHRGLFPFVWQGRIFSARDEDERNLAYGVASCFAAELFFSFFSAVAQYSRGSFDRCRIQVYVWKGRDPSLPAVLYLWEVRP
jgi:hypothetical protein